MRTTLPRWADLALIPALNLLLAFLVAGLVVVFIGEDPIEAVQHPARRLARLELRHRLHALLRHHLRLHRPLGRHRLPCRALQHRRRGPGGARRHRRDAGLPRAALAVLVRWRCPSRSSAPALFGAAWAFIPGYLQAKRGSHVVITTIMFNFIASALVVYLLVNVLKVPGMAPETAQLPRRHLPALHARDPRRRSASRCRARR